MTQESDSSSTTVFTGYIRPKMLQPDNFRAPGRVSERLEPDPELISDTKEEVTWISYGGTDAIYLTKT